MTDQEHRGPGRGGAELPIDWDGPYHGTPPWDIGRPQTPFIELADAGWLRGAVLDVGCGTGEHTLLAAERGHDATGVDIAPTAIETARAKAEARRLTASFLVADVLTLGAVGPFDTVLDCGFFHVLSDPDRIRFADLLRRVLAPGGRCHLLCFSDAVPGDAGPRRIGRDEIHDTFAGDLTVEDISGAYIEATFMDALVPAWLARITR